MARWLQTAVAEPQRHFIDLLSRGRTGWWYRIHLARMQFLRTQRAGPQACRQAAALLTKCVASATWPMLGATTGCVAGPSRPSMVQQCTSASGEALCLVAMQPLKSLKFSPLVWVHSRCFGAIVVASFCTEGLGWGETIVVVCTQKSVTTSLAGMFGSVCGCP